MLLMKPPKLQSATCKKMRVSGGSRWDTQHRCLRKLPPCVVSSTSMHTYAWGPFAKSGSMQDIQQSFGLKALKHV